ncbi:response regulator [Plastorhodobacter daqingensis]|uniref:Response regulator n=1 Tax=Plastorhodobacter daqingensis TaxID=1387281 RepID=A0ABW2UM76_9RHOB
MTQTWTPSSLRLLYLEDEAIIALETVDTLHDLGFNHVDQVYTLEAADQAVATAQPDIALLDVNLSHGRTSFDLSERLLAAGVPVVMATGYSRANLPAHPAVEVIEKPTTALQLEEALQRAWARRDALAGGPF